MNDVGVAHGAPEGRRVDAETDSGPEAAKASHPGGPVRSVGGDNPHHDPLLAEQAGELRGLVGHPGVRRREWTDEQEPEAFPVGGGRGASTRLARRAALPHQHMPR